MYDACTRWSIKWETRFVESFVQFERNALAGPAFYVSTFVLYAARIRAICKMAKYRRGIFGKGRTREDGGWKGFPEKRYRASISGVVNIVLIAMNARLSRV